jgi:hypothetical protein
MVTSVGFNDLKPVFELICKRVQQHCENFKGRKKNDHNALEAWQRLEEVVFLLLNSQCSPDDLLACATVLREQAKTAKEDLGKELTALSYRLEARRLEALAPSPQT